MNLTLENEESKKVSSRDELRRALETVGRNDNNFAILGQGEQVYIQTTGTVSKGFLIEFRDGSEDRHYTSKRENISQDEMIRIFLAYFDQKPDWKRMLDWTPPVTDWPPPVAPAKRKLATSKNAVILAMIGMLILYGAHWQKSKTDDLEKHLGQATGLVLEAKRTQGKKRRGWLDVTVRFAVAGKDYTVTDRLSGVTYHRGDKIPVVYDTREPASAFVGRKPNDIWREHFFLEAGGWLLAAIAVILFVIARRTATFDESARTSRG